ncbi:MAG: DUF6690 family protein [Planctomycetota bacterium]|nr:DUF6690 family protein [Planctomycetota bacterium]
MFQRHFLVFALLVAVVGVPAFLFESGIVSSSATNQTEQPASSPQQQRKISLSPAEFDTSNPSLNGQNPTNSGYPRGSATVQLPHSLGNANASPAAAPIRGLPFSAETDPLSKPPGSGAAISSGYRRPMQSSPGMSEIFRFDLTPQIVKSRWTRVSVTPTDYGLKAMRVALVTGTTPKDVHGALTFYFDKHQQLQRITLRGWSGDASRLVKLVTGEYGFKAQNTHMSGLYLAKTFLHTKGALLMQDADVIDSNNPTQQVAISMEINNPDGPYILSPEFSNMLPR